MAQIAQNSKTFIFTNNVGYLQLSQDYLSNKLRNKLPM